MIYDSTFHTSCKVTRRGHYSPPLKSRSLGNIRRNNISNPSRARGNSNEYSPKSTQQYSLVNSLRSSRACPLTSFRGIIQTKTLFRPFSESLVHAGTYPLLVLFIGHLISQVLPRILVEIFMEVILSFFLVVLLIHIIQVHVNSTSVLTQCIHPRHLLESSRMPVIFDIYFHLVC